MLDLSVAGMTCSHCVTAVTTAIRGVPGAGDVTVDLGAGRVTVAGTPDPDAVRRAITEEGYDVRTGTAL